MFQEVLSLDPDWLRWPQWPWALERWSSHSTALSVTIVWSYRGWPIDLTWNTARVHVSMHISEPEIYSNTEGIIKGSMNALRVCQFGLCTSTCTHIKTDKYICVCAKKCIFQGKTFLSCSVCFCLPRWRPVGYGATPINTVEGKRQNKIKPHTTRTNTTLRRHWEDRDTVYITRKNEKAHIHTRDMTQPKERDNNNTEAHQTTAWPTVPVQSSAVYALLAIDTGHDNWVIFNWASGCICTCARPHACALALKAWSSHTDTYTRLCTRLVVGVFHRAIPFSLPSFLLLFFFFNIV